MPWGSPLFWFWSRPSVDEEIIKKQEQLLTVPTDHGRLLTTAEIFDCYGKPGDPDNMTTITTPYPFRIAWDANSKTSRVMCHKKIANRLLNVFNELLLNYGAVKIIELGIDLFGGLYNFRPMRGLEKKYAAAIKDKNFSLANTYLSRHSWAVAIDLDPNRNGLKTKWKDAQFSKPEYKYFVDTFYKFGFIGYGPERNYDAMHFEIGVII